MCYVLTRLARVATDEVFDKHRNVLSSLSKRRNLDRENLQAIKQIITEGSAGCGCIKITIRGGDHTNVDLDGLRSSDPLEFLFLKDSQQGNLRVRRQFAHFVQENRSPVGQLETANSALRGFRKCSLLVTEQFGSN